MTRSRATQPRFERLDADLIRDRAYNDTRDRLDRISDTRDRLTEAVAVLNEAEADMPRLRRRRDALAVSLAFHDGVRAVHTAAGMSRTQFVKVKHAALGGPIPMRTDGKTVDKDALAARVTERGIRHYKTALTALPRVASELLAAQGTAAAARDIRDAAIGTLLAQGVKQSDIAVLIDREPSRVAHIAARTRPA